MKYSVKNLVLSAMFIALGMILPFFTGQIPSIGSMLLPLHIPVLICGFMCGPFYAGMVGIILPILRSMIFTMPPMYPTAIGMALEMCAYGVAVGVVYRFLPKKSINVYVALISAMLTGRIVWGFTMLILMGLAGSTYGLQTFIAGAFIGAI
ncbi:MAG: ECF transporter S component, partial [Epulopiscium sp. Nuni2H_MBin001]